MCGIAAIINYKRPLGKEYQRIERMVQALDHRGPDENQFVVENHALLGHTRLAIIDLEQGKQPMTRMINGRRYTIIYNGMIYNYEEIKKELEALGYVFQTTSDTEVLLYAYAVWKEECLHKCNGIFAFLVESEEEVFAARDQMGVKPLYYVLKSDGEWQFASEIKAFFAEGSVVPILTKEKFAKMIALGPSVVPGETIYKNIKSLKPGHYIRIKANRFQIVSYYTLNALPHQDSLETTIAKVHHLVSAAIARQTRSDVPIGSMLSGGLDSSIVSLIASKSIAHLPTFSLEYEGNDAHFQSSAYQTTLDAPFIEIMKDACQSDHRVHTIGQSVLADYLDWALKAKDMPAMADIDSSLLWFCEELVKHVKVILSGECADEIFGGYPWFYREDLIAMDTFPWLRALPEKLSLLQDSMRSYDFYGIRKQAYENALDEVQYLEDDSIEDKIARKMTYLCKDYFMQTLLSRQDAMSSAVGLEGRVPFADVAVFEYVYNIPWKMKYLHGQEKGILRAAFADTLPNAIMNRKKNPYPKTHHPAYTKLVTEKLQKILKQDSYLLYLFDEKQLKGLMDSEGSSFDQPWFGQLMKGPQLLAYLYQMELWFQTYHVKLDFN